MKCKTIDNIVYRIVTSVRYYKYKRNHDKTKPYSATNINHHTKGVQCFLDYCNCVNHRTVYGRKPYRTEGKGLLAVPWRGRLVLGEHVLSPPL